MGYRKQVHGGWEMQTKPETNWIGAHFGLAIARYRCPSDAPILGPLSTPGHKEDFHPAAPCACLSIWLDYVNIIIITISVWQGNGL